MILHLALSYPFFQPHITIYIFLYKSQQHSEKERPQKYENLEAGKPYSFLSFSTLFLWVFQVSKFFFIH
jgi:hypothetical protein